MNPDETKSRGIGWPWTAPWTQGWSGVGLPWPGLAPQVLEQPINPGWSFGNITVTHHNSSAPDIEGAVLQQHSYGRQIGRMMNALSALVEASPTLASDARITGFKALAQDVERIKGEARHARLERLGKELRTLREQDPEAWAALMARLGA